MTAPTAATLSVREAAELLGRDRTRVYALVRSGDLVAVTDPSDPDLTKPRCASTAPASNAGPSPAAAAAAP